MELKMVTFLTVHSSSVSKSILRFRIDSVVFNAFSLVYLKYEAFEDFFHSENLIKLQFYAATCLGFSRFWKVQKSMTRSQFNLLFSGFAYLFKIAFRQMQMSSTFGKIINQKNEKLCQVSNSKFELCFRPFSCVCSKVIIDSIQSNLSLRAFAIGQQNML